MNDYWFRYGEVIRVRISLGSYLSQLDKSGSVLIHVGVHKDKGKPLKMNT